MGFRGGVEPNGVGETVGEAFEPDRARLLVPIFDAAARLRDFANAGLTRAGAMRRLGAAGIPAGAVLDTKELVEEPTFWQRGILQTMEHPTVKDYGMPTWPVRHGGAPPALGPAPLLGEHTGEVLQSWLGLDGQAIEGLIAGKVVQQR